MLSNTGSSVPRLTAILLFAALLLPLAAPLFSLGQPAENTLPLCCRRNGAHHCSMSMGERSALAASAGTAPRWRPPVQHCPFCPATVTVAHSQLLATPVLAPSDLLPLCSRPASARQTEIRRRIARERSRHKRGPPVLSLA